MHHIYVNDGEALLSQSFCLVAFQQLLFSDSLTQLRWMQIVVLSPQIMYLQWKFRFRKNRDLFKYAVISFNTRTTLTDPGKGHKISSKNLFEY